MAFLTSFPYRVIPTDIVLKVNVITEEPPFQNVENVVECIHQWKPEFLRDRNFACLFGIHKCSSLLIFVKNIFN